MSQARFVPGHKNIWRCKGTRKMCKWQTEIIQPKTEHSTAAATESDMNYSVLQAHRTKFFPGEGGRDDLPPNHISKTNVLTFLISHEISVVSPRPSVITRKTCDFHCRSCVIIFSLQETISILFAHLTIYFCSPSSPSIVWNRHSYRVKRKILPRSTTKYKWIHQKWRKPKIPPEPKHSR